MTNPFCDKLAAMISAAVKLYPTDAVGDETFAEFVASRLLESVPGEERMAAYLKRGYRPGNNTETAWNGFYLATARFLREHVGVWL